MPPERTPPSKLQDFAFHHDLRVRWAEVDPQGIVFNPNYFVYADVGVGEYLRAIGLPYPTGLSEYGTDIFAAAASADFRAPAHYDDELHIGVRVAHLGRTSLRLAIGVFRDEACLVDIALTYVNATIEGRRPAPLPEPFVARVLAFERTAPTRA